MSGQNDITHTKMITGGVNTLALDACKVEQDRGRSSSPARNIPLLLTFGKMKSIVRTQAWKCGLDGETHIEKPTARAGGAPMQAATASGDHLKAWIRFCCFCK